MVWLADSDQIAKPKMATIYLLRHAQTTYNAQGILQGHLNTPLSEEGREQATAAGKALGSSFDAVYASDLIRCKDTAKLVLAQTNPGKPVPETYLFDLRERHLGELQGMSARDAKRMCSQEGTTYRDYGEQGSAAQIRAVNAFKTVVAEIRSKGYKRVLVVSHGSVIPRIIREAYDQGILAFGSQIREKRLQIPHNASISKIQIIEPSGKLVLESWDDRDHLVNAKPVDQGVI